MTETLYQALLKLSSPYLDGMRCFCDMRIGNPNIHHHSDACDKLRHAIIDYEIDKAIADKT